ncbi:MAG: tetratricopeptide repeat protein [Myxococcales bacterium]|nr:tetratricopeptide repeat protein [Myxococcota bacterium]MDW8281653.1 tetratricopeptide repeat protein [Myxococcales bacterium]
MQLREQVAKRLRSARHWPALLDEIEREVERVQGKEARAAALFELGEVCEDFFLRKDRAMAHYQQAFKLNPQQTRALTRARNIYREMGNLEMVATLLNLEVKVNTDPARKAEAERLLGLVRLDARERDLALPSLQAAVMKWPDDHELADALAACRYNRDEWLKETEELVAKAQRLQQTDRAMAIRLYLRAARILQIEVRADPQFEDCLRRVLSLDPQHEVANFLLEKVYGEQGRFDEIMILQERRAEGVSSERERIALWQRNGAIWLVRWQDKGRAAYFYGRVLESVYRSGWPVGEVFPGHLAAFHLVREVHGARGEWDHVLRYADLGAQANMSDEERIALLVQAAEIAWREAGDVGRARGYLALVKKLQPDHPVLQDFTREHGEVKAEEAAGLSSSAQQLPDLAAEEATTQFDIPDAGVGEPTQVVDTAALRASAPPAVPAVEVAGSPSGSASGVQAEPSRAARPAAEPQPASTGMRPPSDAATKVQAAEQVAVPQTPPPAEGAMQAEEDAASLDASVRQAMEAARALEGTSIDKAIDAWRKVVAMAPHHRAPRRELARVLRGAERWNALADVLKDEVDKVPLSTEQKVATLFELVDLYKERLRLDTMVVNTFNAILALQPGNLRALDAIAAQYEHMKRWPDLIGALQKKAAQVENTADKVAIFCRIARLFQEKFSNVAEAIKAYEQALALDPDNAEAIAYLKTNYEKRRDWEKLIGVHQREIERISDPVERGRRYVEVAKLASEKLKKPAVSIELWQHVLEADPDHAEALAELEKLYEREKIWDRLADVCERQAALFTDPVKKVAMLQKLGILFTDRIKDPARATHAWRELLAVEPENRRAQDAIKKLYLEQKAWDDLEAFYARQNKYDEFIRVLERQVDTEDEQNKIVLYQRIAVLYRDRLDKPDRAMRAFEKVLALDPRNLEAAEALIPLYEAAKDSKKLAGVLEIQIEHTSDVETRLERVRRLAELLEQSLKDKQTAYGWYLRAFAQDHRAEWVRTELERLAAETGGWAQLVEAYAAAVPKFGDPVDALPLLLVVARVYEEQLRDADRALETNRQILAIDEHNPQAIEALERLYLRTARYRELLEIYQKKLDLETDPAQQKEIRYRIASVYENEIRDPDQAIAAYRAILDGVGGESELPAWRALDRIFTSTQRWHDLQEIIPRELALVDPGDTTAIVDLKFRLGQIREQHLGDVAGAIDCYREILDLAPAHEGARQALEARLRDPAHQVEVAAILQPIYEQLGEWLKLIDVHEIQLSRTDPGDTLTQVSLLQRIGELWAQQVGDTTRAFDAYSRCFRIDPAGEQGRAELERLAAQLGAWSQLVVLYEEAIRRGGLDSILTRELLMRLAAVYDERLERSDKAVEFYKRAQEIDPEDLAALEALEKLYTRHEQWPDLLEVYRRKVELAGDPATREKLFFQMAYLWEEILGNFDQAIATYREVLAQDDSNIQALRSLDRLFLQQRMWTDLSENLQRQLALTTDNAETIDLLVRLAALRERELGEIAAAIDTYRQVLELDPLNDSATAALEQLIKLPDHELTVAQILEPIYKHRDEWARLVEVYEIMVRHSLDPIRKIELLHEVARLYEEGGEDGDRAFATYARALREDPTREDTQRQLERLARFLDRWQDLVTLYTEVVEQASHDIELQVAMWTRIAQIYETQLGQNDQAAAAYQRVLAVDPQNLPAANSLEAIYLRTDSYQKLVEVVLAKVEMVTEVQDKKDLYFKAARLYVEVLESPDKAIEVYRSVLQLDENDPTAIDALERLYIELQRWNDLKDIYGKKAELASTIEEKKQILFVLGQVYDRELKDVDQAIVTYQTILDLDPNDIEAIQALDRLYVQSERWYDLLQILEREVELARTSSETVQLKHRIGKLFEVQLKDLVRAVEAYREVLDIDGTHEPTLAALDGIVHGNEEPVLAAQVLEPIFETSGEWEKLIDVLEVMVRHSEDPIRRVELLHRIAGYYERHLDRPGDAFVAFGRALRDEPTNEQTISHLERLAEITKGWSTLAQLYESEISKMTDPVQQVEMLLRVARVYEEELQDDGRAISTFIRVLEVEPDNASAILALDRLYERGQHWAELADILRREIRLANSDAEVVALQFRLGQLYEQALRDVDNAIEVYREILANEPNHGPTLQALELLFAEGIKPIEIAGILEPLYRVAEEWEKLVKIHEVQLDKLTDESERQALLQRIAEICEHKLVDQPSAFTWWCRAFREQPMNELAGEEVERLAKAVHSWEELVGVYLDTLHDPLAQSDPQVQRHVLLRVARVYEFELRDVHRAEEAYIRVLGIDARDPDALAALDRIYDQLSMWPELADVLRRRIEIITDTDEIIELYFRLGRVYSDALEDPDHAIECYQAILENDSRNGKALEALERIYFRREAWQELFGIYEKMVDIAVGDEGMAECYARMARIASDALNDRDRAIDLWGRVVDLRGEDPMALSALARLYEDAQMWRELVDILERQVRITELPEDRIPLYRRLGQIWGEKLSRERNALEAWQEVLEIDPRDLDALRAIAHIYRQMQSWEDLVDTLHRLIEAGQLSNMDSEEIKELYAELGTLYGDQLLRPQDAIDAWRRVLQYDGHDFRAMAALENLFTQEARWEECVEILEKRAAVLEDVQEKIGELLKAAAIWEDKVVDPAAAADTYERILQLDKTNLTASIQLEQIYRSRGNWSQLTDLLLARVEFTTNPQQRIEILQSVAEIFEQNIGDREGAFVVLQAAFKEDYSNDQVCRELERLASITGKWGDLLTDYTTIVREIPDKKAAADLWVKIGRWYAEHLGRIDYAIASEQQALQIDPNHKEALSQLADCYRKTQQWPELVQVVDHHANVEDDPPKRVELLLDLAQLYELYIKDPGRAIAAYRRALSTEPSCLDALNALERLYNEQGAYSDLIEILGRKAGIIDDIEEVVRLKYRIGQLYEERLGDPMRAIESYKEILTVDPVNLQAMKALELLYEKTGQNEAYLDILEQQLDVTGSDEERISLYQRIAQSWEQLFNRPERACDALEKILELNDRHEPTLKELERLYHSQRRWQELVDTYRRHIMATGDRGARMALYAQMGEVYEIELRDLDRAIEAYSDILSFDPNHIQALVALGRLYEKIEDWNRAIDTLSHLVTLVADKRQQVELHTRIGRLHDEHMEDQETAEGRYLEALRIDPTYVPAMQALVDLYKRRGDWLKAAQYMVRAEEHIPNQLEKVKLLYEVGMIYRDRLDDEQKAAEYLARVIALDPEHVGAAEPLAEMYFRDQKWRELEPILDMLVRKADRRDTKELNQLYFRLAKTADNLGNNEKALRYYKAAYDLDSTYLPTLLGRAALLYRMEDWEGAFKLYQTVLVHHREAQKESEIVDIFYRLGIIKLRQGERKKALNMFEKALEIDASHRPTLLAVIELQSAQNDWEAVIHAKRSLLPVADAEEKFRLLTEIGDLYAERLQNPQKAIASYLEAVELKPDSHVVLHKILDLYTKTEQWKKAIEILNRIAAIEKDPLRRGKFYYTAAVIFRDALKSSDEAIDYFNMALDAYFEKPELIPAAKFQEYLKPFEAIDKICTTKKDWKNQERNYRKMIKRMPPSGHEQVTVALWHALGEIYRSRLREIPAAIQAFEVAAKLDPDNAKRHEILAELYILAGPDYADKAVAEQMLLISKDPFKIDSYKALQKIYMNSRQYDRAWCMCAALVYLQRADADETQFFEQYKPKGLVRAKARLTDEMWNKYVYHPDEDRFIGNIFAAVYQAVALMKSGEHKQFGLKRKERRDLATDQALFSKVFTYVSQVLNIAQIPEVYFRPDQPGDLQIANTREKNQLIPSIVVGQGMLAGRSDKELAYPIATFLAKMRPEHYLRQIIQTNTELSVALMAAIRLVAPTFNVPPQQQALVDQYQQAMRQYLHFQQAALEHLQMVVKHFIASKGQIDLGKWAQAVDLTAHRVGFIIANDLQLAARAIGQDPVAVGGMLPKDKVKELVLYAISPQYFELRQLLGIAIG